MLDGDVGAAVLMAWLRGVKDVASGSSADAVLAVSGFAELW